MNNVFRTTAANFAAERAAWSLSEAKRMIALPGEARAAAFRADAQYLEDGDVVRVLESFEHPELVARQVFEEGNPSFVSEMLVRRAANALMARRQATAEEAAQAANGYRAANSVASDTNLGSRRERWGERLPLTPGPAPKFLGEHWKPYRYPPAAGRGGATIATGLSFVAAMEGWVEREAAGFFMQKRESLEWESVKEKLAKPDLEIKYRNEPEFLNLLRELKEAKVLGAVLSALKKEVGSVKIDDFPKGSSLIEMVQALASAAFIERSLRARIEHRPGSGIPEVLTWWKEEFRFSDNIEAHVISTLANPSLGFFPRTDLQVFDYNARSFKIASDENRRLLADTILRLDAAAKVISLCRTEIERRWRPPRLKCDPTDAEAVAAELSRRLAHEDQPFNGVGRYIDDIICLALCLGPTVLHAVGMVMSGRRKLGDPILITQAAGLSTPVVGALVACASAIVAIVILRKRALKNRIVRAQRWSVTWVLGLTAWLSVMMIPTYLLPKGSVLNEQDVQGSLVYVSSLKTPIKSEFGKVLVVKVQILRGPFSGRAAGVSQAELDELRSSR